ncbi:MAG: inositol monophosphatase family protein [Cyclobacteriaceae bacterium]
MNLTEYQLSELKEIAKKAAKTAGEYIQSQFDQHYVKQKKEGGDSLASQVVTEVDIKAQEIILGHLADSIKNYDLGLLTEESEDDNSRHTKDYFWCIDPMDGTLPFTERRTGYAVSIALISKAGDPVVSAVYIPDLEECYAAVKGLGVELNEEAYSREGLNPEKRIYDVYWDQSFKSEPYFNQVLNQLNEYAQKEDLEIKLHTNYGGVRNAIGVTKSYYSSYFKFPKKKLGCGSIWDYAATRLFFEELDINVANSQGERLHLNNNHTTFMNEGGILYATNSKLAQFIIELGKYLKSTKNIQ